MTKPVAILQILKAQPAETLKQATLDIAVQLRAAGRLVAPCTSSYINQRAASKSFSHQRAGNYFPMISRVKRFVLASGFGRERDELLL
jgi:hypothetical protein